jgi:hypothetical protein
MPLHLRLGVLAPIIVGALVGGLSCAPAAEPLSADQQAFLDIYRELIEINTTESSGDTLRAADAMAARLRDGGLPAADIKVLSSAQGEPGGATARHRRAPAASASRPSRCRGGKA